MAAPSVTFCFLVVRDLVKEMLWRRWLDRLDQLDFPYRLIVHCSHAHLGKITSQWLKQRLIPVHEDTAWGQLMPAQLALYREAMAGGGPDWVSLHSEFCVPMVSPEAFIAFFDAHRNQSLLRAREIWWNVESNNRGNLQAVPVEHRVGHDQWCILTRADLAAVLAFCDDPQTSGFAASMAASAVSDESFTGVALSMLGRLAGVDRRMSTLVDWARTETGDSPHTFAAWGEEDVEAVDALLALHGQPLFLRKVAGTFPDEVVEAWWGE